MSDAGDDRISELFDRWSARLDETHLALSLPAESAIEPQMAWLFVGSCDPERNRGFLQAALPLVQDEFLTWLSQPSSPPAYWGEGGHTGVRLPFELGTRSWTGRAGIPEELTDYVPLIKLAVVRN